MSRCEYAAIAILLVGGQAAIAVSVLGADWFYAGYLVGMIVTLAAVMIALTRRPEA